MIFKHRDYKQFLKEKIQSPDAERGYVRKLAEAAGCQRSYLSSVIHSHQHLTPDQAYGLCMFWRLEASEIDYFLTMVDLARCGTPALKKRLSFKLDQLTKSHENLATRLERNPIPRAEVENIYYSAWVWSALHIATSIPAFQQPSPIAEAFRLPLNYVKECLHNLESLGLVKHENGRWMHASQSVHVPRESPLVALHHGNWRNRAILHAQVAPLEGVHYTTITAMSKSAFREIHARLLDMISEVATIAAPSESEHLTCMNLDFFMEA